jgi:hypothetical protein
MKQYEAAGMTAYIAGQYRPAAASVISRVNAWLRRGDGIAVYENLDMSHPDLGQCRLTSYGSPAAQLEAQSPPEQLPDGLGGGINWRYRLTGTYRGAELGPHHEQETRA